MRYVVLGSSAAGINGAREIRKLDKDGEILLISKDETIYSRCIMHYYMSGRRTMKELSFVEDDFFNIYNIDWIGATEAVGLDSKNKIIKLSNNEEVSYDKLLIATGSKPFLPPIKNIDQAKNVFGFRNIEDALQIMELAEEKENIVIVGAGLVGVDAVAGLVNMGKNISLVEMADRLLSVQLDKKASFRYERAFEKRGVKFHFNLSVKQVNLDNEDNVKSLTLSNGKEIACELLIVAAGVRPNTEFLKDSNLELERGGLLIDSRGRTNNEDIYGAGDVTGWGPIWPVAVKEGIIAAGNMVGIERKMTDFFTSKSTMNFFGIPTMSLGTSESKDDSYIVETEIDDDGNYKKIIHKDGKIHGAILQGDLSYAGTLTQLIKEGIDVSKVKKSLFKIDYSDFFNVKDNFEFTYKEEA